MGATKKAAETMKKAGATLQAAGSKKKFGPANAPGSS